MKKSVKLLSIILLFTMTAETYAQTYGVKAGLNIANQVVKDDDQTYSDDFDAKLGFHIGPTAEFDIHDMFSFETGLILSTKGFKYEMESFGVDFNGKVSLLYLDIPLTARGVYDIAGIRVFGNFGPYIGIALSGSSETEFTMNGDTRTEEGSINFGSGDGDDLRRFDFGLAAGAGVELDAVTVGISYGLGLADISPEENNGFRTKNRVFSISVGYKFSQF